MILQLSLSDSEYHILKMKSDELGLTPEQFIKKNFLEKKILSVQEAAELAAFAFKGSKFNLSELPIPREHIRQYNGFFKMYIEANPDLHIIHIKGFQYSVGV